MPSDYPLRTEWSWQEGAVDRNKEHIEIRYGNALSGSYEEWTPVALISKPVNHVFSVSWLKGSPSVGNTMIEEVCRELDFYLIEKREPEPWKYAIYHCSTAANMYSNVHWSYFPDGQQGDRQASRVVKLP